MNRKQPGKNPNLFLIFGLFGQTAFYRRPGRRCFIFCILLIPMMLTSCTTLPLAPPDSSTQKRKFESLLLSFYNGPLNHLNGVRRGQCPMYPSCSAYCDESLKKHGFWVGWMMACDRLMRCGRDELTRSPKININGQIKCYDPVSGNDNWWYKPDEVKTPGPEAQALVIPKRDWIYRNSLDDINSK